VVEGVNMRVRHVKKTTQQAGQRIHFEASLHASNVMLLDPKTKKPTRIGYRRDEKTGRRMRIAKKSNDVIAGTAAVKKAPAKGTATGKKESKPPKASLAEGGETKESKQTKTAQETKLPTKQPFWKRGGGSGDVQAGEAQTDKAAETKAIPSAHRSQGG
jgi:hypothetical protein